MRVGGLGGSAENVPPVATLLIPIAPVIADEPFVEKKKRGPATEAILTALRDHRGLFWRVGFVSLLMNLLSVVSSLFTMQVYDRVVRSEEHTSELQSLMRISYAVFCLKKKT